MIVFASGRDNKNGDQIYSMAADGSKPTLLTKDFGGGWMPAISPDRTKIAFDSTRASDNGAMNIYVMGFDGSDVRRVTADTDCCSLRAAWSPDGRRLVYEGNPGDLFIIGADGSGRTRVSAGQMAAWSPDGKKIALCDANVDGRLDIENTDGSALATLTSKGGCLPAWSPDGMRIAFSSTLNGKSGIFVINADGSAIKRLTSTNGLDDWPAWSPDGTMLAFQRGPGPNKPSDIWVMRADGTHLTNLTNSPTVADWAPSWR